MKESVQKRFIKQYSSGKKVSELCKKFGICKSTAYNWIKVFAPIKRRDASLREVTPSGYYALQREVQTLKVENDIFHRCGLLDCISITDKFKAIEELKGEFSVHMLCKTLGLLKSTYYHHKLRSIEKTCYELNDEILCPLIEKLFRDSHERLGSPKIAYLLKQQGHIVDEKHVKRLMDKMGLICKATRLRYFSTTNRKYKYYRNKVQRKFNTEAPNLVWVSDITYIYVKDVTHYVCVVIDLYARKVVAYGISDNMESKFVRDVFDSAFESRGQPSGLTFHSDQGSQYTAFSFRKHLRKLGVTQSFSNPGTPLDNAVAENFFASLKREELSHNYYDTPEDLERDVADYIDYFNNMRPHQRLGMLTPTEAEQRFNASKTND